MAWSPCPTLPVHLITPRDTFFFIVSLDEKKKKKILKEKLFADVEEVKKKMTEALKGIEIDSSKTGVVEKKNLARCIASNGKYADGDYSLNM